MKGWLIRWQRMLRLSIISSVVFLTACAGPGRLEIDRSIEAVGQNSRVQMIVLHYTSAGNQASLNILSKQAVSAHYLITDEPRPTVYQLVDEGRRAWHAGVSNWYSHGNLNSASIGIELVNPGGQGTTWAPYSDAQIKVLIQLLQDISKRHPIKPENYVGHSDVSPQRKVDPGPLFPWRTLAAHGFGRWFDEELARQYALEFELNGLPDVSWIQTQLRRVGYSTPDTGVWDKATQNVLAAFQMHYRPARYDGQPDAQTLGILRALPE